MRKEAEWLTNLDYCSKFVVRINEEQEEAEHQWYDTIRDDVIETHNPEANKVFIFLVSEHKMRQHHLSGTRQFWGWFGDESTVIATRPEWRFKF